MQLRQAIVEWAASDPEVRAVIEVGAGVRTDHPADAWSDLDLELYLADASRYAAHTDWFEALAPVWVYLPLTVGDGTPSRLIIYEGGHKVDFVLYSVAELKRRAQWQSLPELYRKGYRVRVDKDGLAARIPPSPLAPSMSPPPSAERFEFMVHEFWFEAFHVAKYLRRGDLWSVKLRERALQDNLLLVLEWHAQVVRGVQHTWHDGRFMQEWVDVETWAALHNAFSHFDAGDSWAALFVTMDTFRRLAHATAASLGYLYPVAADENITRFIEALHRDA